MIRGGYQSFAQVTLGAPPFARVFSFLTRQNGGVDCGRLHVVVPHQYLEEAPAPCQVEHQIRLAQLRRAGSGRYLAAAGFQASVDLLPHTIGVGIR